MRAGKIEKLRWDQVKSRLYEETSTIYDEISCYFKNTSQNEWHWRNSKSLTYEGNLRWSTLKTIIYHGIFIVARNWCLISLSCYSRIIFYNWLIISHNNKSSRSIIVIVWSPPNVCLNCNVKFTQNWSNYYRETGVI